MAVKKFLVSACLAGVKCRYDGKNRKIKQIYQMVKQGKAIPFCPEQLSGLSTPRIPAQVVYRRGRRKVISECGEDLSRIFQKGAEISFNLAKRFKINSAYLKSKSPSCGYRLNQGVFETEGITSAYFLKKGMKVFPR